MRRPNLLTIAILTLATACAGACAAEESNADTCSGTPVSEPTEPAPSFEAPDYMPDNDDAEETASVEAWNRFILSTRAALAASKSPRDWALATMVAQFVGDEGPVDNALLPRAVAASPDDLLVQWIGLISSRGDKKLRAVALRNLERLEPENAAHWMGSLEAASRANDEVAIDRLLSQMGASRAYTNHFGEVLGAMAQVYRRFPAPPDLGGNASPEDRGTAALTLAMADTATGALPGLMPLVQACRIGTIPEKTDMRRGDCANVGRLMAAHGTDLLTQRIGSSILRVSKTYTNDDKRFARDVDWIDSQFNELMRKDTAPNSPFAVAHLKFEAEMASEVEAMRRSIVQAGIAPTPPDNWVDNYSPFSDERILGDATYLRDHPLK